jgi:RNA polymerase sigma factor (sigma-70 family)
MEVPRSRMRSLSVAEAAILRERALAGDRDAARQMIASVSRMIHQIAGRFESPDRPDSDEYSDRVQGAIVRLLDYGIRGYDPSRGCRWTTYAWHVVHNEIKTSFNKSKRDRERTKKACDSLADQRKASEWSITDPYEEAAARDSARWITSHVARLPKRQREILEARHGLAGKQPLSLKAIGDQEGISKERVRQILEVTYRELREICEADQDHGTDDPTDAGEGDRGLSVSGYPGGSVAP